ncbi:hypothetical protein TNCV_4569971 [Trichonephila clavipes]|nr:hypothetical protein TNCV_4569971 [Trichonephila clavipes]
MLASFTSNPTRNVFFSCFVKTIGTKKDAGGYFQACHHGGVASERIQTRRCLVGENPQGTFEKSQSTPEKHRQEDAVHL